VRHYEIPIIFDVGLEEEVMRGVVDRVTSAVTQHGGTPGRLDRWGRRRLAYEIGHRSEGYYMVLEFTGSAEAVAEAHRILSLADEVLRHKVIRLPDGAVALKAAAGHSS